MNKLPEKPSDLIYTALGDLEKCETDPGYEVNMDYWHTKRGLLAPCSVCLAGSVMAKTLKMPKSKEFPEMLIDEHTEMRLFALDDFRKGWVNGGFKRLKLPLFEGAKFSREITPYDEDPEAFKKEMGALAYELREAGC